MKTFAALYNELDQTTRTGEKVESMARYFSNAPSADAIWAVALLTGRRPKRPVNATQLKAWATGLAGIPPWLFDESYSVVGDLAETISLLIPPGDNSTGKPLEIFMSEIISLPEKTEEEKKSWLYSSWQLLSREELLVFNKLITGSYRVGVSAQLVFKALAKAFNLDEKTVAHRLMGSWSPADTTLSSLLLDPAASSDHSRPYPFYLAYQLDVPFSELGDVSDWIIERKYDGIRGQVIVRNNEVHTWSRGEDLMTEKFTEFAAIKDLVPNGTVLDGEVLPFREGRILSFAEMQKRIGRKNVSKKILSEVPLCLMCYDLLEYDGTDIRQRPLSERRRLLEELVPDSANSILKLSPLVSCDSWEALYAEREESRRLGCEGLMLKHRESVYETGRRRGKWWKWKVDPYTVDAVLVYAQAGHGRRANLFTDYTFAVWDQGELVPFTKAYSGLTDKEIQEVDSWIRKHTIERFGPVRSVKAELVFEIAFEGINASSRHKSGLALRFPRILRWRKDKKKEEANTKSDLLQLLDAR